MLQESELSLDAALQTGELLDDLLELRDVLGWDEMESPEERQNELMVFYLTVRSGVLVSEVRVAWADEALSVLRAGSLPKDSKGKVRVTGVKS